MAKKHSRRKKQSADVWMPHVSESVSDSTEVLSEEALRAKETVDDLVRDLFGESEERVPRTAPTEPESAILPEEDETLPPSAVQTKKNPSQTARAAIEQAFAAQLAELSDVQGETAEQAVSLEPIPSPPTVEEQEPQLPFKEYIESSNQDFKLLLELGYEDELGNAIGFERIRAYHERGMNGRLSTRRQRSAASGAEFEKQSDDVTFRRAYARKKTKWTVMLALSIVMLILLMLYERPGGISTLIGGPLDGERFPASYILFGIQLLILDAILCYRPLVEGFLRLVRFSPIDHSLCSVLLITTFTYHILLLFMPHTSMSPVLYLSPAGLCIVLICGVELLNTYRESLAFDVISARRQKFALLPRISVGSKEHSAKENLLAGRGEDAYLYAKPVGFVRNYFANTKKHSEYHHSFGAQLFLIIAVGVALGLYALASGESAQTVARTVFASMLLCTPIISLLLTAFPLFFAAVLRLRGRGAIVGETPLSECDSCSALVLPDAGIFAAMEHEHLRLAEDCDAHQTSVLLCALLEKLQSPLAYAFSVDAGSRLNSSALSLDEIADDGVLATLHEGADSILFGTPDFLRRHGVDVHPREEEDPDLLRRLMCVAINEKPAAFFQVRYTLSADVERLIFDLGKQDLHVLIRSKDPCVRDEIFGMLLPRYAHAIRVQKPSVKEMEIRTDRVDVSIVSLGSCKETARTYIACKRARRVGAWGKILQASLTVVGALYAAAFTYLNNTPSAMTVTLWLIGWCLIYAGISYLGLRRSSNEL